MRIVEAWWRLAAALHPDTGRSGHSVRLESLKMLKKNFPVSSLAAGLGLAFAMLGTAHAAVDTQRVIVTFKPGTAAARLARAAVAHAGGQIKLEIDGENIAVVLPK